MSVNLDMVLLPLCFMAVAFFEGMESGVVCLNHARLMHLVRTGSKAAKLLNAYLANMQRFLTTIQVGCNLSAVILSTLSAGLAQTWFEGNNVAQALWGTVMAFMVLFFSEYLPKLFFTTRPLRRTLLVARLFFVAEKLLTPLTVLVLFLTDWLVPKGKGGSEQRFLMTREYIQNVVSDPRDGSRITAVERLMINRVLALQAQTAAQVMTPLSRVSFTTEGATLGACYQRVRDSGHVRLPVFSEDGAKCVGVLNTLDVLSASPDPEQARVRDFMRPPLFVSGDVRADDVLPLMRKGRQPMAMVRSAHAETVLGIITEENILRSLTGSL